MFFLLHSDTTRFGTMQDELYTDMIKGDDNYPVTPTAVYDMMLQWTDKPEYKETFSDAGYDESNTRVSFTMVQLTISIFCFKLSVEIFL